MPSAVIDAIRVKYEREGEGLPLVMLEPVAHGRETLFNGSFVSKPPRCNSSRSSRRRSS